MIDSTARTPQSGPPRIHSETPPSQRILSGRTPPIVAVEPSTATTPIPTSKRNRRELAGSAIRRVLGVTMVAAALWWLALPLVFPVTNEAIVNARTVQVRAPIEGTASELTYDVGDPIAVGQPMARLVNLHLDTSALTGLTARQAELVTRRERLEKEMTEVVRTAAVCRAEADRYRDAVVINLEATQQELLSKSRSGKVEHEAASRRLERVRRLPTGVSDSEVDAARETESVTRIRLDTEQATLNKCRAELEAAKKGLFLQKDSPHFQQRAEELALRLPTLRAALKEAADLLAGVESEILREQARTERLSLATAEAPVAGTVWARQSNIGQGVRQNEVLFEIAASGTVFVEAVIHQHYLGAVSPGTPAIVNVTGGPSLQGRVRAVRTGRPGDHEPTFAFGAIQSDPKMLRVMIDLDPGFGDPSALIGRHVRVLIADADLGPCHRAVAWMFSNVRLR